MKRKIAVWQLCGLCLAAILPGSALAAGAVFGPEDQAIYGRLDHQLGKHRDTPAAFVQRVSTASALMLGTPYIANTLIGGPHLPEQLVVRFDGVDCYTFIDLVRAFALSDDREGFIAALEKTRYHDGRVAYLDRRHFLTDWVALAPQNARDITRDLSSRALVTRKMLNQRAGGGVYIEGLDIRPRDIAYLPPGSLTPDVAAKIHTGDVIGIYTALAGLDVTHTGLAIWRDGTLWFRNASSLKANMKVIDIPLADYVKNKPGFLVLRMNEAE